MNALPTLSARTARAPQQNIYEVFCRTTDDGVDGVASSDSAESDCSSSIVDDTYDATVSNGEGFDWESWPVFVRALFDLRVDKPPAV